jgi:hypothetical protein
MTAVGGVIATLGTGYHGAPGMAAALRIKMEDK